MRKTESCGVLSLISRYCSIKSVTLFHHERLCRRRGCEPLLSAQRFVARGIAATRTLRSHWCRGRRARRSHHPQSGEHVVHLGGVFTAGPERVGLRHPEAAVSAPVARGGDVAVGRGVQRDAYNPTWFRNSTSSPAPASASWSARSPGFVELEVRRRGENRPARGAASPVVAVQALGGLDWFARIALREIELREQEERHRRPTPEPYSTTMRFRFVATVCASVRDLGARQQRLG